MANIRVSRCFPLRPGPLASASCLGCRDRPVRSGAVPFTPPGSPSRAGSSHWLPGETFAAPLRAWGPRLITGVTRWSWPPRDCRATASASGISLFETACGPSPVVLRVTHLRMRHTGHRGGGRPIRERTTPVLPPHEGQLAVCPRLRSPHAWGRGRGLRERAGARRKGRLALRPRVPLKSCPRCRVPGLWEATLEGLSCSPLFGNTAPARGRACRCHSGTPTQPSPERVVCRSQWPRQLHLLLPFITDHHPSQVPETSAELPLPTRPA